MSTLPAVRRVEITDRFVHVIYREPERFNEFRTPAWLQRYAGTLRPGTLCRTGILRGHWKDFHVHAVLVPYPAGTEPDVELAQEIAWKVATKAEA